MAVPLSPGSNKFYLCYNSDASILKQVRRTADRQDWLLAGGMMAVGKATGLRQRPCPDGDLVSFPNLRSAEGDILYLF